VDCCARRRLVTRSLSLSPVARSHRSPVLIGEDVVPLFFTTLTRAKGFSRTYDTISTDIAGYIGSDHDTQSRDVTVCILLDPRCVVFCVLYNACSFRNVCVLLHLLLSFLIFYYARDIYLPSSLPVLLGKIAAVILY
jgi:hypothetical protein